MTISAPQSRSSTTGAVITGAVIAVAMTATTGSAHADTCPAASYDNYVSGSLSTCTIGDLTYSAFTYDPGNTGYPASGKYLYAESFGNSLYFDPYLSFFSPVSETFGFTVTAPTNTVLTSLRLTAGGYLFPNNANTGGLVSLSNGVQSNFLLSGPGSQDGEDVSDTVTAGWDTGASSLAVSITATDDKADFGSIQISFTEAPAPIAEPGSLALVAAGLTTLAALRARRQARRNAA